MTSVPDTKTIDAKLVTKQFSSKLDVTNFAKLFYMMKGELMSKRIADLKQAYTASGSTTGIFECTSVKQRGMWEHIYTQTRRGKTLQELTAVFELKENQGDQPHVVTVKLLHLWDKQGWCGDYKSIFTVQSPDGLKSSFRCRDWFIYEDEEKDAYRRKAIVALWKKFGPDLVSHAAAIEKCIRVMSEHLPELNLV